MYKVLVTPVIGLPQFNGWSQIATSSDGRFVFAFAISGQHAGNVGRDLVDFIKRSHPRGAAQVLSIGETVLHEIHAKDCQIEFASGLFTTTSTILCSYHGFALLKRGQKIGQVLSGQQDKLQIIEGKASPDDVYVLSTAHAQSFVGEIKQKMQQGFDVDTIVTSLVPGVHSVETSSLTAMAFTVWREAADQESIAEDPGPISLHVSSLEEEEPASRSPEAVEFQKVSQTPTAQSQAMLGAVEQSHIPVREPVSGTKNSRLKSLRAGLDQFQTLALRLGNRTIAVVRAGAVKMAAWQYIRGRSEVYLDSSPIKTRAWLVRLGLVILLISIGVGLFFGWRWQQQRQQATALSLISPLRDRLVSAQALVDQDILGAREQVRTVIVELEAQKSGFKNQKLAVKEFDLALVEATTIYNQISGEQTVSDLPLFFDLRTLESDLVASYLALSGENLLIFDTGKQKCLVLDLPTKQVRQLDLSGVGQIKDIAVDGSQVWLLADGLYQVNLSGELSVSRKLENDDNVQQAKFLEYYSDALYVFNPQKKNLYKYLLEDDTVQQAQTWLRSSQGLQFDQVNTMEIDGEVWLGTRAGETFRFAVGREKEFSIVGIPQPLVGPLFFETSVDGQFLSILEPSNQRIVVVKKADGLFQSQLQAPSLATATSLAVNEATQKAYVVSGSLIFEANLLTN